DGAHHRQAAGGRARGRRRSLPHGGLSVLRCERVVLHALFAALAAAGWAAPASAHGFGQRYDLPIPLSFYLVGVAAAVVVSFVVVGLFVRDSPRLSTYPRLHLMRARLARLIAIPALALARQLLAL